MSTKALKVGRRGFLAGVSVAIGTLPVSAMASAPVAASGKSVLQPLGAAIYRDQVYMDTDGTGAAWDKPEGNRSTRDYVNSLTQEEFLSRHWFS